MRTYLYFEDKDPKLSKFGIILILCATLFHEPVCPSLSQSVGRVTFIGLKLKTAAVHKNVFGTTATVSTVNIVFLYKRIFVVF